MAPGVSPERVAAATAALDRVRAGWLRHPGVTAVDVGLGAEAAPAGEPVLRVHVEAEQMAGRIAEALPRQVDGFAVRIIEGRYGLQDTDR